MAPVDSPMCYYNQDCVKMNNVLASTGAQPMSQQEEPPHNLAAYGIRGFLLQQEGMQ